VSEKEVVSVNVDLATPALGGIPLESNMRNMSPETIALLAGEFIPVLPGSRPHNNDGDCTKMEGGVPKGK
jgi:hypothetical protein